jgi:hypothetical protein
MCRPEKGCGWGLPGAEAGGFREPQPVAIIDEMGELKVRAAG